MKALQHAAFAVALLGLSSGVVQANAINGTQGFADLGAPSANTGDVNTATIFTIGDLRTTGSQSGAFSGLAEQDFGGVTFDTSLPTSLSFGNAIFGTFTSTSITKISNAPGTPSFFILGTYVSGTYAPGATGDSSSFTIGFTQTPAHTGSISDSASFADPPAPPGVPEPATLCLFGSALIGLGFIRLRRKV